MSHTLFFGEEPEDGILFDINDRNHKSEWCISMHGTKQADRAEEINFTGK